MYKNLPLNELREQWAALWGHQPHKGIGRAMLETSLTYKTRIKPRAEQQAWLDQLIKHYKRNPKCFDQECAALKPGTRLIRNWKGKRHSVLAKASGFDYQGKHYTSLSQIANDITGSRWNGRVFFGLKNKAESS
jgi:hypothetical protein